MSSLAIVESATSASLNMEKDLPSLPPCLKPTSVISRTPWRLPVAVAAQGIYVDLEDRRRVIDGCGGAAVTCLGNGHPAVIQAIKDQADRLVYVYSMQLSNEPAEELATHITMGSKGAFELVGFVSGGSEAVEGAIKLARQYFYDTNQPQRKNFIARKLSYHGNTVATVSLGHHPARRAPYADILDSHHFHHVSPAYAKRFKQPDESDEQYVDRLKRELDEKFQEIGGDSVIGFVAETVVGATTGVVPAPRGYFKAVKSVCDKYGALLILDEVMCGMGRMGTTHAWQSYGDGVAPDIQAVAKGLGGGYGSIGAVLMSKKIADGIRDVSGFWKHGHTYQSHPLACAASLAVQKVIQSENLLNNCCRQGEVLQSLLRSKLTGPACLAAPYIFDIRGGGGFWAIEFDVAPNAAVALNLRGGRFAMILQARALENGLIIMGFTGGADLEGTRGDHIVLAPPYNIKQEETEEIARILTESIEQVIGEGLA